MKTLAWVLLLFVGISCGMTQKLPLAPTVKIDLTKQQIKFNKRIINEQSRLFDITKALGRYDRTFEIGNNYAYFYDKFGILVLESIQTRTIERIEFQYVAQNGKKATEQTFTGNLSFNKHQLKDLRSPLDFENRFPAVDFQLLFDVLLRADLERCYVAVLFTEEYDPELITINFSKPQQ